MTEPLAIGVEIGGTALRLGLITPDGSVVRSARGNSSPLREQSTATQRLLDEIVRFADQPISAYAGIGVAMAGLVDNEARSMVLASNLGWRDFRIGDEIKAATGMLTVVDKDTNMAALGELAAGAGQGLDSFIYVTLGTGVGGAVIHEGRLLRGIGNRAGEFGHVYAGGDGLCGCGLTGCLETISGGESISRRASESSGVNLTTPEVIEKAEEGDEVARAVLAEAAEATGIALLNAVRMIYPQAVIIGGSVGGVRRFIFDPIKVFLETNSVLPGTDLPSVRVLSAGLGDTAAIIGAGSEVWRLSGVH